MDIGSLLLIITVALLTGLFVVFPFLRGIRGEQKLVKSEQVSATEHEHSALLAKREQVLAALHELDMDHELGKIPTEDYPAQRGALLVEGVSALKALEELEERTGTSKPLTKVQNGNGNGRKLAGNGDDSIEQMIAARKRERKEKTDGFCPKCGSSVVSTDAFCSKCGSAL